MQASFGDLITNSKDQASVYFASVFTNDDGATPSINPRGTQNTFIDSVEFTSDCIFNALKHLKPTTSSSPDGIPNICLKIVLVHLPITCINKYSLFAQC